MCGSRVSDVVVPSSNPYIPTVHCRPESKADKCRTHARARTHTHPQCREAVVGTICSGALAAAVMESRVRRERVWDPAAYC